MTKYYILTDNEQKGPYTIDQLPELELTSTTPIWHVGLPQWASVADIPEVYKLISPAPPPVYQTHPPPPAAPQQYPQAETPKSKKAFQYILTLVILSIIGFGGFYLFNQNAQDNASNEDNDYSYATNSYSDNEPTYEEKVVSIAEEEKRQPTTFLSVIGDYKFNLTGRKVKITGNIYNAATTAAFKDVVVRITFLSKTNTALGSEDHIIYENFPPSSQKDFFIKIENSSGGKAIQMEVVTATPN